MCGLFVQVWCIHTVRECWNGCINRSCFLLLVCCVLAMNHLKHTYGLLSCGNKHHFSLPRMQALCALLQSECSPTTSLLVSLRLHALPILALRLVACLGRELESGAKSNTTYLDGPAGADIQGLLEEGVQLTMHLCYKYNDIVFAALSPEQAEQQEGDQEECTCHLPAVVIMGAHSWLHVLHHEVPAFLSAFP